MCDAKPIHLIYNKQGKNYYSTRVRPQLIVQKSDDQKYFDNSMTQKIESKKKLSMCR